MMVWGSIFKYVKVVFLSETDRKTPNKAVLLCCPPFFSISFLFYVVPLFLLISFLFTIWLDGSQRSPSFHASCVQVLELCPVLWQLPRLHSPPLPFPSLPLPNPLPLPLLTPLVALRVAYGGMELLKFWSFTKDKGKPPWKWGIIGHFEKVLYDLIAFSRWFGVQNLIFFIFPGWLGRWKPNQKNCSIIDQMMASRLSWTPSSCGKNKTKKTTV